MNIEMLKLGIHIEQPGHMAFNGPVRFAPIVPNDVYVGRRG